MKLKNLDRSERPREKMMERGAAGLSNGELLAVLLREGYGERNALDLGRELLESCGGTLDGLFNSTLEKLCRVKGVGPFKAAAVLAALELGKRFTEESSNISFVPIVSAREVYKLMIPRLKGLKNEESWALFLNVKNYVIGRMRIGEGGIDSTVVDTRKILREALDRGASSVVLVHNHPSGNPTPGTADIKVTSELSKALHAVGLSLLDHVVIGAELFFSFADNRSYSA